MAIIDCPECGKKVSDKAELCPHCHKKVIKVATVNQPSYTSSNDRLNIESSVRNLKSKNKLWFLWIGIAFIIVAGIVTSIWIPVEKNNKKKLLEKEFQAFNQSKLQMSDLESIWKEGDNFFEYKEKLRNKGFKNKDNEDELYIELTNPSNGNIYTCSVLQGCGAHFCNIYVEFGNYIDALEFYEQVKGISALVEEHYDWSTDTYTNWYARWFLDGNTVRWDYDN